MEAIKNVKLRQAHKVVYVVGIFMIITVFALAGAVEFLKKDYSPVEFSPTANFTDIVRYILLAIALGKFVFIKTAQERMFSSVQGGVTIEMKLVTSTIVAMALCESIALYGLLLFFLTGDSIDYYTFMVLSLAAFAYYFPRYPKWEARAKKSGVAVTAS